MIKRNLDSPALFGEMGTEIDSSDGRVSLKLILISVLVAAIIFIFDTQMRLGVAGGVPYVALVLLGYGSPGIYYTNLLAVISTILVIAGYFLSPDGGEEWVVLTNRGLAFFAIWVTSFLMGTRIKYEGYLQAAKDNLEFEVAERTSELKDSEARFRAVTHYAKDAIISADKDGIITQWNRGARHMFGYQDSEIVGQPISVLIPERHRGLNETGFNRMGDEEASWLDATIVEAKAIRKDGTEFPIELSLSDWRVDNEAYVSGIIRDVTVRKETARKLHEKTRELQSKTAEAEAANASKSAFLANMSHEIRTPMNGVIGMVDILMHMDMEANQKRMIQTIRNSSFSLLRIIDDILDASKIEAGKLELENVPVQLHQTIEDVVETIIPTADDGNIRLALFIDPLIPDWIISDAVRLRQVMLNLFSNAIKFSRRKEDEPSGRVTCWVEIASENTLQFKIIDDGIGMSEEVREKLFKPFMQGEESTTRKFGGTGLGLVISQNLVEMMGGTITVESAPGMGSTFTVTLPYVEAEGAVKDPGISRLKLLALVDEHFRREPVSRYVEHYGSTLRYAENEAELAAWVAREEGNMIILLACQTMAENERIREALSDGSGLRKFLQFTAERSDKLGTVKPHSYVIPRSPIRPSDLFRGFAALSGRAAPDADLSVERAKPSVAAPSIEEAQAQNRLILLVEDNETNQEVITYQLDMLGYAVEVADDGRQGLAMWRTGRFGLVLSDCHMPEMDGLDMTVAIRKIEKQEKKEPLPIIAITASAMQGETEKCLAAGMDGYLLKPVELKHLEQILKRWLPKQSEQGSLQQSEQESLLASEERP